MEDTEERAFLSPKRRRIVNHKPRQSHKFVMKARTASLMDSEALRVALLEVLQASTPTAQVKLYHAGMSSKSNGKPRRR